MYFLSSTRSLDYSLWYKIVSLTNRFKLNINQLILSIHLKKIFNKNLFYKIFSHQKGRCEIILFYSCVNYQYKSKIVNLCFFFIRREKNFCFESLNLFFFNLRIQLIILSTSFQSYSQYPKRIYIQYENLNISSIF